MRFTPGPQLQRQLNYTKSLVALLPDVVPNAQNRALKKRKLDSNSRYGPVYINQMTGFFMTGTLLFYNLLLPSFTNSNERFF